MDKLTIGHIFLHAHRIASIITVRDAFYNATILGESLFVTDGYRIQAYPAPNENEWMFFVSEFYRGTPIHGEAPEMECQGTIKAVENQWPCGKLAVQDGRTPGWDHYTDPSVQEETTVPLQDVRQSLAEAPYFEIRFESKQNVLLSSKYLRHALRYHHFYSDQVAFQSLDSESEVMFSHSPVQISSFDGMRAIIMPINQRWGLCSRD